MTWPPARLRHVTTTVAIVVVSLLVCLLSSSGAAAAVTHDPSARTHVGRRASAHHVRDRHRAAVRRHRRPRRRSVTAPAPALRFGIYPGGAAGTVGPSGPITPEDPAARLAALQRLRSPRHPFILHLYAGYTGPHGWSANDQIGKEIAVYTAAGFEIEPTLTYRPDGGDAASGVAGFVQFTRQAVRDLGADPGVVSLQVTNEANLGGAPNASDGYYPGAENALIQGVIAARAEAGAAGFSQLKVGFNWAWSTDSAQTAFWSALRAGGPAFTHAVDWVGLDVYPGTWGPSISGGLADGTNTTVTAALSKLRHTYLPLAGLGSSVALHVSESGYPTGPGRTEADQVTAMQAAVGAVNAARSTLNVTQYCWFDLRDNQSASASFEDHYGLMTDTYAPKPAFATYQGLIARLG